MLTGTAVHAITFQIRKHDFYQTADPARQRLPDSFYAQACKKVHGCNKEFGIAICEIDAIPFFNGIGVDFWKTLTWDFSNVALQRELQATGKPVYMSTGTSSMADIVAASREYDNVRFIHTQLSEKIEDANLKAIATMRETVHRPVAFGLHSHNHDILKLALAYEPEAQFFYVKEDDRPGLFDDKHAILLSRVGNLVDELAELLRSLGSGVKAAGVLPDWIVP